jgi:outer membrane biosynthesis protein TonB
MGVAIAEVTLGLNGQPSNVKIVEAPSDRIARSVEAAAWQWRFKTPTLDGKPASVRGKLIFYFQAHGRVIGTCGMKF